MAKKTVKETDWVKTIAIIFAVAFFSLWLSSSNYFLFGDDSDPRIFESDSNLLKLINIHMGFLEEEGYEILFIGDLNGIESYDKIPFLKMKSFGVRSTQVWSGLMSLSSIYPDESEYTIAIMEPTQGCYYVVDGDLYKTRNEGDIEGLEAYAAIETMISETICS